MRLNAYIAALKDNGHSQEQGTQLLSHLHPDAKVLLFYDSSNLATYPKWTQPQVINVDIVWYNNVISTYGRGYFLKFLYDSGVGVYCHANTFGFSSFEINNTDARLMSCHDMLVVGNHYDNTNVYYGPDNTSLSAPCSHMAISSGTAAGPVTSYGPTLDCLWGPEIGEWVQSYITPKFAGLMTVLRSVSDLNSWDVRRLVRAACSNYAAGWNTSKGYGRFRLSDWGFNFYNNVDPYAGGSSGPLPFTQNDVNNLVNALSNNLIYEVEPPAGIAINLNYDPVRKNYFEWYYNTTGQGNFALSRPWGYPNADEFGRDPTLIQLDWIPFMSKNWKSTVITANDNIIYEGPGTGFIWPCNVANELTLRFYTRALNGALSREDPYTVFTIKNCRKFLKVGSGRGPIKPRVHKPWTPPIA